MKLREVCGAGYEAFELHNGELVESTLAESDVRQIDATSGLASLKTEDYDVVIHNHLLSKLACNYTAVLQRLHQLVKPGGIHIFSVPVHEGHSQEDLDPTLAAEVRSKRFGQPTHYRRFGIEDFDRTVGMVFNVSSGTYRLDRLIDREVLSKSVVPEKRWSIRGGAVIIVRSAVR